VKGLVLELRLGADAPTLRRLGAICRDSEQACALAVQAGAVADVVPLLRPPPPPALEDAAAAGASLPLRGEGSVVRAAVRARRRATLTTIGPPSMTVHAQGPSADPLLRPRTRSPARDHHGSLRSVGESQSLLTGWFLCPRQVDVLKELVKAAPAACAQAGVR
jgi:hypothetical protein